MMKTLEIKKNTFSDRKKKEFFDRYRKAKQVDLPALVAERYDIALSPDGKRNFDTDEGFRLGMKRDQQTGDEIWLATGSVTGDAVQTVQQLESARMGKELSRSEALEVIEGFQKGRPQTVRSAEQTSAPAQPTSIKLPAKADRNSDDLLGYVQGRGISWSTVTAAESEGFLQRSEGGLTFIGRDADGNIKQAETRLMKPFTNADGKEVRFLCAPGSDRSFPPILHGSPDSKEVHIVEGGFDALAVREREARRGNHPTIIMAGGKDSQKWVEHDHIKGLLADKRVVIWRDNEKNEEVQAEADAAYKKLCQSLQEAGVKEGTYRWPDDPAIKDVADLNKHEKAERLRREQEEARRAAEQQQATSSKSR